MAPSDHRGLFCVAGLQMRRSSAENGRDRWRRRDKHKVLAKRELWRGFLLNYVTEHVRGFNWRALIICHEPVCAFAHLITSHLSSPQFVGSLSHIKCGVKGRSIMHYLCCSNNVPEKWTSEGAALNMCTVITVESEGNETERREVGCGSRDVI